MVISERSLLNRGFKGLIVNCRRLEKESKKAEKTEEVMNKLNILSKYVVRKQRKEEV